LASIFLLYVCIILLCCRYSILYYYALSFRVLCYQQLYFKKKQFKLLIFWLVFSCRMYVLFFSAVACKYSILYYYAVMHCPFGFRVINSYFFFKKKEQFKLLIFRLVFSCRTYVLSFGFRGVELFLTDLKLVLANRP